MRNAPSPVGPTSAWARGPTVLLLLLAAASPHQDAARRLAAAEQARAAKLATQQNAAHAAQLAAARAAALAQQRVAAATALRDIESKVNDAQDTLAQANQAAAAAEAAVHRREADLTALLPIALRLARYPAETLLAAPVPPQAALEGLLASRGVAAEIAREVSELRAEQAKAAALKEAVQQHAAHLATARARQNSAAAALDQQLAATRAQEKQAQNAAAIAAQDAASFAAQAHDLRGAIAAMEVAERRAAAQAAAEAQAEARRRHDDKAAAARARQAALSLPAGPGLNSATPKVTLVAGKIVRGWGQAGEDGPATGITFATAPAAFVASPCAGRVGFAGPFRSYGKLLIIECGGGYDFVLAGFGALATNVGQKVRGGEPLGRMPDYDVTHAKDRPGLYVELRRAGQAVDPLPYLNGKG